MYTSGVTSSVVKRYKCKSFGEILYVHAGLNIVEVAHDFQQQIKLMTYTLDGSFQHCQMFTLGTKNVAKSLAKITRGRE